jgi:hypothetical protein
VNCVFLSYNWGLPPELEADDWRGFERAARICHDLGMMAAAYIQPSNAAPLGSFARKEWYAVTPKGKRIPYYNGRSFTCLNDDTWRVWVLERCLDACRRGADVLFFDNCAFGGMPIPLSRDYTAFAGCACERCRERFRAWQEAAGLVPAPLPRLFRPGRDEAARRFAAWRAGTLTDFLRGIVEEVRGVYPATKFVTNTVGGVNVNTFNVFGADLPAIAAFMDWLFVENLQSPRAGVRSSKTRGRTSCCARFDRGRRRFRLPTSGALGWTGHHRRRYFDGLRLRDSRRAGYRCCAQRSTSSGGAGRC